jgi:hypothetical protein
MVQVSTQPKTGACPPEGLGFRRSDGVISVSPRFSIAGVTSQAIDGDGTAYQYFARGDGASIPHPAG